MKTLYQKLLFLMLILPLGALAQSTLSGMVTDARSGQPLPGVNVVVEGSNNGVSTDFDGKYQLTNLKNGETVTFTYIGYQTSTVKFTGQATANVAMAESANELQEVVVQVGYGSVRKKDATGAVTVVGTKDFNKGANVTAENLLNGRVAGLTINTSGAPGSGSEIRIRGGASLFASNDPLIVVDGLPIDNKTNTGSTSSLGMINPNDIESFTVLKDASATAIYGSRGSNGVIIITTKRGSKNLSAEYNVTYGSGKVAKQIDVFSPAEFRAQIAAYDAAHGTSLSSQLGNANTDWQNEIYRRTDYIDQNLSIRGNLFKRVPARLSFGNTYQEGLRLLNNYTRNTISTSLNPSFFTDHLKFRVNATYSNEKNRFADAVENSAIRYNPTQPVYDANSPYEGFFEFYHVNGNGNPTLDPQSPRNPVAQLLQTNDSGRNNRILGNIEMEYKFHFFPDLKAVVNAAFDESHGERTRLVKAYVVASGPNNASNGEDNLYGTNEFTERILRNKLIDSYLNYNHTFGKTNVDITGGYSYQRFEGETRPTGNRNAPNYVAPTADTQLPLVLIGFFGRANLSFDDTYLLTLSYRRDGSSRFDTQYRWGNFPAAAFAWKMKNNFFKDSKTVSDMKLRLGYGISGQQDIGDAHRLDYLQLFVTGNNESQYYFGPTPTPIVVSSQYNPKIKWEETTTYNVGYDLGLFSRVNATVDAFYKISRDLLVPAALPDGSNFSNAGYQNIGSFTTKGVELGINADIVKTQKFNWNVNFNVTKFERRIDELALNSDILVTGGFGGTGTTAEIMRTGYTPFAFYVYHQLYDASGKPIEGAFADLNGDGQINGDDRYIYKNPDPDATFGFASNLNWGNLDFSFNLRASVGNHILNAVNATSAQSTFLNNQGFASNIPRNVLTTGFDNNSAGQETLSDVYIENASFLKLDNVTVGYTFPKWLEGKASLRFFAGMQNVFTWTKYTGLDPEITNNGVDNTIYPRQRQILVGANVKF